MRYGTSHFKSIEAAIKYYAEYIPVGTRDAVALKIRNGEIHIGKPKVSDDEKLLLDPAEGRYIIEKPE